MPLYTAVCSLYQSLRYSEVTCPICRKYLTILITSKSSVCQPLSFSSSAPQPRLMSASILFNIKGHSWEMQLPKQGESKKKKKKSDSVVYSAALALRLACGEVWWCKTSLYLHSSRRAQISRDRQATGNTEIEGGWFWYAVFQNSIYCLLLHGCIRRKQLECDEVANELRWRMRWVSVVSVSTCCLLTVMVKCICFGQTCDTAG